MRKLVFIFLFICYSLHVRGQANDSTFVYEYKTDFTLLTGFNQARYSFAEIGLALNKYGWARHPFAGACFIASELKLSQDKLIGPKVGVWVGGGLAMGVNLTYYTNFNKGTFVFRPEYGLGFEKMKLVYGYNWNWTTLIPGINRHQIGAAYCFTIKRLKEVRAERMTSF